MKKAKITPLSDKQNDKILIDEQEFSDSGRIEYICSSCNCGPLVTITDKAGNSDLFCRRCGITYDTNDNTVRHKQRLSVPLETEPAVSIVNVDLTKDVEINHTPEIKGGLKSLQQKGLKITHYEEHIPK